MDGSGKKTNQLEVQANGEMLWGCWSRCLFSTSQGRA